MLSQIWFVLQKKKTIKIQGKVISREIFPKKRGRLLHYLCKILQIESPFPKGRRGEVVGDFQNSHHGEGENLSVGGSPKNGRSK